MKGIYSGRQILALKAKGMKITRSQTAAQAEKAIIRKYGSISPEGKYFHVGKGNWNKYSLKSDQTRTGRLAPDLKTWREAPHKWDMRGIDTKKEDSGKKKARVFSVTAIKGIIKPTARKSIDTGSLQRARIAVKQGYNFKVGFEWTNNSKDRYRITGISGTGNNKNIKYINVAIPSKTYVTNESDLTFDLGMQKRSRKIKIEMKEREEKSRKAELERKKKEEAEYQKKLEGLEGFETTLTKMNKPRAIELLNSYVRNNGVMKIRKDLIRELVKEGYTIGKNRAGKIRLEKDSSIYDSFSKTEYDFAAYLIKKHKIKPKLSLSALKGPAKLAGRKNKSQPKLRKGTIISTPKQKVVTELKRGRAKTLKYKIEILRNQGKSWENSGMIVDSKEKADAMIASANSDGFGRKLRAIPVYHITGDGVPYHTYEPVETKITKKPTKPKSEIKANHVYGSFMRPLWIGFNPGVAYREIKVTDSHKDFRFNRKPHAVIVTARPIAEEKIKALELTDLIKGKKLAKEVKRIKGLNFLDGNMKESLISQVLAGKDKAVIDKYIEKGKQLAEKKQKKQKFSVSKLKQSGKLAGRHSKTQPRLKNITPKTKVIITKAPKITIDQHFTKGKKSGSYAPTRIVNTPLEAFKIYMKHKDKYDTGLMFEAGAGTLTTANEITQAAKVDTPSVIYNAIVKKLNLDKYYAYLKYTDDPMKLKTSPLRTLALRENWNRGAVL